MRWKRILKWCVLAVLIFLFAWFQVAYWTCTNDCGRSIPPGTERMKAIRYCEYGSPDVLKIEEIEKPVPKEDELLVRVHAASLNFIDAGLVRGPSVLRLLSGLRKPKFTGFGQDFAGVVEAVGKQCHRVQARRRSLWRKRGSVAEYVCVRKDRVALKPSNITFEQAGAVKHAGLTALQGLRTENPRRSESPDQRRIWRCWNIRAADRKSVRHGGHCGSEHAQRGNSEKTRRRSRHRLHERGFHQRRGTVRPALRQRHQSLHVRTATYLDA